MANYNRPDSPMHIGTGLVGLNNLGFNEDDIEEIVFDIGDKGVIIKEINGVSTKTNNNQYPILKTTDSENQTMEYTGPDYIDEDEDVQHTPQPVYSSLINSDNQTNN